MIDPSQVCLFIPPGLKKFKLNLFEHIGGKIEAKGGRVVRQDFLLLANAARELTPIVGCTPELRPLIDEWISRGQQWIYWDRGYARRVFATWLPKGENGGYYRWHVNSFQSQKIKERAPDRWNALATTVLPWRERGSHIVVAAPTPTYERFHRIEGWLDNTLRALARLTDRQIVVRDKESKRPLQSDLLGAHCLIAHGSNAAVEAVIMGCPVIVDRSSAAALVGRTELTDINKLALPDRQGWLNALAYSQFNEAELVDGTLWRLLA